MNKNSQHKNKDSNWMSEADASFHSSEWIGALFRYFINFGKKDFKIIYRKENTNKNVLIGWLFKIILFILIIVFAFHYFDT